MQFLRGANRPLVSTLPAFNRELSFGGHSNSGLTSVLNPLVMLSLSRRPGETLPEGTMQELAPPGLFFIPAPGCRTPVELLSSFKECSIVSTSDGSFSTFELCQVEIIYIGQSMKFLCLYRPPSNRTSLWTLNFPDSWISTNPRIPALLSSAILIFDLTV